jgi:hypothetical protein
VVHPAPARRPAAPRSLADDLRGRDDDALADLLARRPDLAVPLPPDLTSLAAAAAGRLSVQRAVDGLDTPTLQVLEVLAALPEPVSSAEVGRRFGAPATAQLATLRALALVWGPPRGLRLVRAARDTLGAYPAGLGPPLAEALDRRSPQRLEELLHDLGLPPTGDPVEALRRVAEHLSDPATLDALLAGAPAGARDLLDRLVWGPPVGSVADADRPVRAGTATSPVDWLLAHGLLAVSDPGHVVLPRELGLALRGGRVHRAPDLAPPPLPVRERTPAQVDGTAAGAAAEAVRLVEEVGRLWGGELGRTPAPPVLRSGGLGVRDLRRLATALEVDEETAAIAVEIAHAAGLVGDDGAADPAWLPTPAFDEWADGTTGLRWAELVAAWWDMPRAPGLVGSRDAKDTPVAALSAEAERPQAVEVRRRVVGDLLDLLPAAPADTRPALAAGTPGNGGSAADAAAVVARLDWTAPRRSARLRGLLAGWTLREAAWLGVTGAGAVSTAGAALLGPAHAGAADAAAAGGAAPGPDVDAGAAALDAALPDPVDHVLLQADLTAVAPGPLRPALARELALAADVESRGGATVYRFTPSSVRRALDAGRTGDELLRDLTEHSRTPVPQPLEYLVTDTARRYGRLRVGAAGSYVRAEDPGVLDELLADRRAAGLRLRRLAPTVLAAQAAPDTVLTLLRDLGLTPAAESAEGDLLVRRPDARRAAGRRVTRPVPWPPPAPSRADLLAGVARLRAGDVAAPANGSANGTRNGSGNGSRSSANGSGSDPATAAGGAGSPPRVAAMDPAGSLAVLRDAVSARRAVWIAYLEDADRPAQARIQPLGVDAGRVRAVDLATGRLRLYPVHRVIGAVPA